MAHLLIVKGENAGTRIELPRRRITIGRSAGSTVRLSDGQVSRGHAAVEFRDDRFLIYDLDSMNGTFVNDMRLKGRVPYPLYDGDRIAISAMLMTFRFESHDTPSTDSDAGQDQRSVTELPMLTDEEPVLTGRDITIDAAVRILDTAADHSRDDLVKSLACFQAMAKISADIGSVSGTGDLVDRLMGSVFEVFPKADRASILLRNEDGEMEPVAGRKRFADLATAPGFPLSRGIVSRVVTNRLSILSSDARHDARFADRKSVVAFSIRSLMYAPCVYRDEVLGVICVDTVSREHAFVEDDLVMLTCIAAQVAVAVRNAELCETIHRETRSRTQLSRYFPSEMVDRILNGTMPVHAGGEQKRGTVLFSDVISFTRTSERMKALEVIDRLNRFFRLASDVIADNRGTLQKFEGDLAMAFWNVLVSEDQPELCAIRAGLEIQAGVWRLGRELENEGTPPFAVGVGCNTGEFACGNIGGTDRMEYTVVGDSINAAKRIESLAGSWQVFAAESTYAPAAQRSLAIKLPPASVKGKTDPVQAYCLRGLLIDEQNMVLSIPASVLDADGLAIDGVFVFGLKTADTGPQLRLHTRKTVAEGDPMRLRLDMAETTRGLTLTGNVVSVRPNIINGRLLYSEVALCDIVASEEVLAFLSPGAVIESDRQWRDLVRA